MENKYYTPSIEDIRVGYEFEYQQYVNGKGKWVKGLVRHNSNLDFITARLSSRDLRTLYLTKEQIEAEGWINNTKRFIHRDNDGFYGCEYRLIYRNQLLTIEKLSVKEDSGEAYYDLYEGNQNHIVKNITCPSINEFRYITKLLGI